MQEKALSTHALSLLNLKRKPFRTAALMAVVAICIVLTVAHLIYDIYAYQHCSIIYFVAKELW